MYRTAPSWVRALYVLILLLLTAGCCFGQLNVSTAGYDNARSGANLLETKLTTSNVNVNSFGKLWSYSVSGSVYAQPLYIANLAIPGSGTHNVVFIATMNDVVYAFDADSSSSTPLWRVDLTTLTANTTPVPIADIVGGTSVGNVGIEGTPVIDTSSNTMYLVTRTKESGQYFQRLHALDITTGAEKFGGPTVISGTVTGSGTASSGDVLSFDPLIHQQRSGLALANGQILIAWASHEDMFAYHGWVMAYSAATLQQTGIYCVTPNGSEGGIWMSGRAPAVDTSGNVYYITGNGDWDGLTNFGESFIKLSASSSGLTLADWFTPYNYSALNAVDGDLGASGPILIPGTDLIVGGGKQGLFYLNNTTSLGFEDGTDGQIVQTLNNGGSEIQTGPVYWNRNGGVGPWLYVWAAGSVLQAYHFNGATFDTAPVSGSTIPTASGNTGGVLALSANGSMAGSGILWSSMPASTNGSNGVNAGILRAINADDLSQELWNSNLNSGRDATGNWAKFNPPLVANGRVYVASFPSDGVSNTPISVYGLLASAPFQVTVGASVPGLSFTVDGTTYTSTQTLTWNGGDTHTISTTATQAGTAGTQYVFTQWSDAGGLSDTVTASASTTSYIANFKTQYLLTTAAGTGGTVSPASGNFYDAGTVVNVSATANSNYGFLGWTGPAAAASSAATTVTMSAAESITASFGQSPVVTTNPAPTEEVATGGTASFTAGASGIPTPTVQWQVSTANGPFANIPGATAAQLTLTGVTGSQSGNVYRAVFTNSLGSVTTTTTTLTVDGSTTQATVGTSPSGGSFTVDGVTYTSSQTFAWTIGSVHSVATTSPQTIGGIANLAFGNWSDGGALSHSVTASSSVASYTATFTGASAKFLPIDTTTQGNWTGTYGGGGYIIANGANSPPTYATVSMTGQATWAWESPSFDPRALQTASGATTRIASTFYSTNTSLNFNVNLTDGNAHRVTLYLLDWDTTSRAESISIMDAATNAVLDKETFASFQNGEYASWNVTGNVLIQVTCTGGINAAVSGVFFDAGAVTGSGTGSGAGSGAGTGTATAMASYAGLDTTTQGAWAASYGSDGDTIANYATNAPGYATVSLAGDGLWTWMNQTTDARALQTSAGQGIAATYYGSTFSINVNLTDGKAHLVTLYLLDWDTTNRAETISILDAGTQTVLNTQSFANFHNGEYASWNISGNVIIQVTGTAGYNGVVSGIFFGGSPTTASSSSSPSASPASASYGGLDTTTQGEWTTKYGADGDLIANYATNSPTYASVSLAGDGLWTWVNQTTDPRALTTGSGSGIAATYYGSTFTINVNITDGNTHKMALYLLDWDTTTRAETITILDASTHAVLDSETFANFNSGEYASWNIKGNVIIQVKATGGYNAVVSGIFFGPAPTAPAPATATATYSGVDTTTQGAWTGKYGASGYLIANDANTLPTFATVSLTGDGAWTFASSTTDPRALQIASGSTTGIASAYYSTGGSFKINVNLTDGKTHRIGLYLLDWDTTSRAETITVMDAATQTVLSTQTFGSFQNGEYAAWSISGNVIIQVTDTAGINAVVSGVFVD